MSYTFKGGTHPHGNKEHTADKAIELAKAPAAVILPMSMHIGAPCQPVVKVGDSVKLGQLIAESTGFVSAPIHSTISGTVTKIEPMPHPNGEKVLSVVIENDFKDEFSETIHPIAFETMSQEELCDEVRKAGIVGHGGAAFPTHVKIKSGIGKIDTIVINGAECEPYITSDHRILLEAPWEVVGGIEILLKVFGVRSALLGIEKNKENTYEKLRQYMGGNSNIQLCPLQVKYPQGAEKQLIYALTKREVPSGKLPADAGCAVFNVDTVASIYRYFTTGIPMLRRIVTVSGSAVSNPKNLEVRIGTPIGELIEQCGGLLAEPNKILMGGPMMGVAQFNLEVPTIKGTNAILAFCKGEGEGKEGPCIRCGKCVDVCPMALEPTYIYQYNSKSDVEGLQMQNTLDCIECGACTYVCPAKIPLVQGIRAAKTKVLKATKK